MLLEYCEYGTCKISTHQHFIIMALLEHTVHTNIHMYFPLVLNSISSLVILHIRLLQRNVVQHLSRATQVNKLFTYSIKHAKQKRDRAVAGSNLANDVFQGHR